MDEEARMTAEAGPYRGLGRLEAREAVVRDLRAQGLLDRIQDYALSVGICDRCKTVVEPRLSTQWFVKTKPLAEPALLVVEEGRIRIVPENYKKIYLDWMANIHDWCISRQLWWGHRIPVWYCDACGEVVVARETPPRCPKCRGESLRPETDTLDTWFSSALWPFATLGWPDETEDLCRFYPNDLMIMGFEILFFWGARMIMMGLKFMHDVPFRVLFIHALVRDPEGQKMSKTKGNVIDPLQVTENYGTDAVRFALAISAAPGTDIAFSTDKIESYRAFDNKIWNAGRFILMNLKKLPDSHKDQLAAAIEVSSGLGFEAARSSEALALADRWIFSRLVAVTREMNEALANYRFHAAADAIYHFFWHEFCDWYLEWVKPEITRAPEGTKVSAPWINLGRAFKAALHLLHPFMPFITEGLWHELPGHERQTSISLSRFELVSEGAADPISEKEFENVRELIVVARNAKAEHRLQTRKPSAQVGTEAQPLLELFRTHQETILRLAGVQALNFTPARLAADTGRVHVAPAFDLRLFHEAAVDHQAVRARLQKEREKVERQLAQVKGQLENQEFLSRAPQEVVRGARHRHSELSHQYRKILESLERLG
jgi:valyl-tRNA synthetase